MEAINTKDCGTYLFRVSLWPGYGYFLDSYDVYAFSEEESLEYVLAFLEKHDICDLFRTEDYIEDKLDLTEAEKDEMFLYVDPTMTDSRAYPAYLFIQEMRIETLERVA